MCIRTYTYLNMCISKSYTYIGLFCIFFFTFGNFCQDATEGQFKGAPTTLQQPTHTYIDIYK